MDHPTSHPERKGLRRWFVTALAGLLVLAACSAAPSPRGSQWIVVDPELASRLDRVAAEAFDQLQIAGMSVAVARDGDLVFASGYGFADLADRVPATADTVYRLGSIGKSFTAAAVLQLVDNGRLSLDDSLTKHLPDYAAEYDAVTVRHLLSHTSGVAEGAIAPLLEQTSGVGYTRQEVVDLLVDHPLDFEPGTHWSYSNAGYMLAGEVIESVTDVPYEQFIEQQVLQPLGLSNTTVCPDAPPNDALWASGYEPADGTWTQAMRLGRQPGLTDAAPINMDVVAAAGALCSSVIDLVQWPTMLESELLSTSGFATMATPTVLGGGSEVGYGLGLQVRTFGDHAALAHGGIINGFDTMMATFPADATTVVLLVNTHLSEPDARGLWTQILSAVFDEPPAPWIDPHEMETNNV